MKGYLTRQPNKLLNFVKQREEMKVQKELSSCTESEKNQNIERIFYNVIHKSVQ